MSTQQLEQLRRLVCESTPSLVISPESEGVLLLSGRFHQDIIFPGASLLTGSQFACKALQVVGQLHFIRVNDSDKIQAGRQQRINDIQAIQRIIKVPSKRQRACLAVNLLCRRVGLGLTQQIQPWAVAQLVCTDPKEVASAYGTYEKSLIGLMKSGRISDPAYLSWQRKQQPTQGNTLPSPTEFSLGELSLPAEDLVSAQASL